MQCLSQHCESKGILLLKNFALESWRLQLAARVETLPLKCILPRQSETQWELSFYVPWESSLTHFLQLTK